MTWPNPELRAKLARQAVALARSVLGSRAPLVASTQRLQKLCWQLGLRDDDPIMRDLLLISSKTSHLPLGTERQAWASDALAEKDVQIAHAEIWARDFGLETCREIVRRFKAADGSIGVG
jgi:hypothetical protein